MLPCHRWNRCLTALGFLTLFLSCPAGGEGTLTHADSALKLWRTGLQSYIVCQNAAQKQEALKQALSIEKQLQLGAGNPDSPGVSEEPSGADSEAHPADAGADDDALPTPLPMVSGLSDGKDDMPLKPEDLHKLPRSELVKMLRNKLQQYGLSRREQQRLMSKMQARLKQHNKASTAASSASASSAEEDAEETDASGDVDVATAQAYLDYLTKGYAQQVSAAADEQQPSRGHPKWVTLKSLRPAKRPGRREQHHASHAVKQHKYTRDDRKAAKLEQHQAFLELKQSVHESRAEMKHGHHSNRDRGPSDRHHGDAGRDFEYWNEWPTADNPVAAAAQYPLLWSQQQQQQHQGIAQQQQQQVNLRSQAQVQVASLAGSQQLAPQQLAPQQMAPQPLLQGGFVGVQPIAMAQLPLQQQVFLQPQLQPQALAVVSSMPHYQQSQLQPQLAQQVPGAQAMYTQAVATNSNLRVGPQQEQPQQPQSQPQPQQSVAAGQPQQQQIAPQAPVQQQQQQQQVAPSSASQEKPAATKPSTSLEQQSDVHIHLHVADKA